MKKLLSLSKISVQDPEAWLSGAETSVDFLEENAQAGELVIFATLPHVFMHGVLVPLNRLRPPDQEDLLGAHVFPDDTWGIDHVSFGGKEDRVCLSPPLSSPGRRTLVGSEKLVFRRTFDGVPSKGTYTEVSQKLVHTFRLHFLEERNAFCRLDPQGDIQDVIRILNVPKSPDFYGGSIVTILAKELAEYMALSDAALVIRFNFTRFKLGAFGGWSEQTRETRRAIDLFYNVGVIPGHASYVNGCQIVRPTISIKDLVEERKRAFHHANRQYATFKALDWKNNRLVETSCSPDALSNYFQPDSPLPHQISPVFFRPEVLHRYKADPEKYSLNDRSIGCRGAWHLETYDINQEGQVHTYLRYLGYLPYEEQLYWKSFNEWPKGPISRRAIRTDFDGEFDEDYDPLASLKSRVESLDADTPDWCYCRGEELISAVHYPTTTSPTEWANEILALDQLVVEGFRIRALKSIAERLGRAIEKDWLAKTH